MLIVTAKMPKRRLTLGVAAAALVCKSTVVGGEVLSPQLDGFLHGLAMP